jgi:hypothetical protein
VFETFAHQPNRLLVSFEKFLPRPKSILRRPLSAVSLDGILQDDNGTGGSRTKRVKVLSEEQREAISNLTHPAQMSHAERKRQFGALGRRLKKADTLPPGVLAKWECAHTDLEKSGPHTFWVNPMGITYTFWVCILRFEFLKAFMLNENLTNVSVDAWHMEPMS